MRVRSEAGFTLLELLISMTIGLVVLGSIFSSFTTQKKSYELQEQITVMEQNLRVPLDIITRDLRNAGYNPAETLTTGTSVGLVPCTDTTISSNGIVILSDFNGDGDVCSSVSNCSNTGNCDTDERVRYSFTGEDLDGDLVLDAGEDLDGDGFLDAGDIQRNGNPLVSNIMSVTFTYSDSNGNILATPIAGDNLSAIRVVQVSITARTEREDLNHTTGVNISGTAADGTCRTRILTARVRTRNIGLLKE